MSRITFELTDTYGGEANYSWGRQGEYSGKNPDSELSIVRDAKRFAGLTGIPCRRENLGDMIALYPFGMCIVLFITWES